MGRTKLQKILSTTAILGAFLVVGILILMATGVISSSSVLVDFLLIVGIICFGSISCMIVARYINDKSKRIPVIIVLSLTGLTCLLWIIFVFIGQGLINSIEANTITEAGVKGILVYAKITVFITIQTSFANLVISNLFKLKQDMLIFQGIMYVSNAIMDFWICALILSLGIGDDGFYLGWPALIEEKFWVILFILATVYTFMSNIILRRYEKRRVQDDVVLAKETYSDSYKKVKEESPVQPVISEQKNTIEDRIKKLDDLKEKGLITEEEYSSRKSKILEDI